ncbi:hypothetical protein ASR47_102212 [Janthinobacterium psychrotolerans]|uniref:Uncharacterized protein n=1 Tax=Janthinobacterium psychrotolerans TaxID=1747903 RepID=A0A1A7C7H1_9BURK|nr:hypothetical protein ASR47_102212 [Janthinobacterium psychrotolerans]
MLPPIPSAGSAGRSPAEVMRAVSRYAMTIPHDVEATRMPHVLRVSRKAINIINIIIFIYIKFNGHKINISKLKKQYI